MSDDLLTNPTFLALFNTLPAAASLGPGPEANPVSAKVAVRRCCKAWQRAFDAYMNAHPLPDTIDDPGDDPDEFDEEEELESVRQHLEWSAAREGASAYRNAMPLLDGDQGIRNFLACAAHGTLIRALNKEDCNTLLYAAQVALGALKRTPQSAQGTLVAAQTPPPLPKMRVIRSLPADVNINKT